MKNTRNAKRLVALFLALVMALGTLTLVGCANDPDDGPDDDKKDPTNTGDDGDGDGDDEQVQLPIDYLPDTKYTGTEIHVLEWTVSGSEVGSSWVPWEEIDVDMGDGDPINNAIYDRNGIVEEKYGVTISKEYCDVDLNYMLNLIRTNEATGNEEYQMVVIRTNGISTLCLEGCMADMNEMSYLHTDMPWWSQDSVQSFTLGDALYFAAPEMLLRDKGAAACVYFNQRLADDEGVEDIFQLVKDGDWTMDTMIEIAEDVTKDMDGDDAVSSSEDIYGLSGGNRDMPYFLYAGANKKFATINDDGYLELSFGDEDTITIWQEMIDNLLYSDYYFTNMKNDSLLPSGYDVFTSGHSLFHMSMVKTATAEYRNMDDLYGIVPIPKYDEYQENYCSLVWQHHDSVLGIPASCTNTEAISVALEYMSYLSYYKVYPKFYETIILNKSARDQESKDMLELIFRTRVFDPGQYWLERSMHASNSFLTIYEDGTKNVTSLWKSMESKVNTAVDELNEKIDELR